MEFVVALAVVAACSFLIFGLGFYIRKCDNMFKLMRRHACDIAAIRTSDEWIRKQKELDKLRENRFYMTMRSGEYYYMLDEMMDRKFDAIMKDVEFMGEIGNKMKKFKDRVSGK